jgi:hypothetical protein
MTCPHFTRLCGLGLTLASALLLATGCSKGGKNASATVTPEQVPRTVEQAFQDAPTDVKQQAAQAVSSLQSQNDVAAFVQFDSLSKRSELTAEQRQAAFASWMAANERLQQAAANGNKTARDLLDTYRASK